MLLIIPIKLLFLTISFVGGITQICNPGISKHIYQFSMETCPFGVLFNEPLRAECLKASSDTDVTTFYADLCKNIKFDPTSSKTIQFIPMMSDGPLSEEDSCKGTNSTQCDGDIKPVNSTDMDPPDNEETFPGEEPVNATQIGNDTSGNVLLDQTRRMLRTLVGLQGEFGSSQEVHDLEEQHNLRLTKIFSNAFQVLAKHCNVSFVPTEFGRDVKKMFLFLQKELDTGDTEDFDSDTYSNIMKSFDFCLKQQPAINVRGAACQTHARAKYVEKSGSTMPYERDEFTFDPHKYDVVIDAAWSVVDFAHGLCFGTFSEYSQVAHAFRIGMENLFTDAMQYRWSRPIRLHSEDYWDHFLSTNTMETMRNLDVCIQGAYFKTIFPRMERPLNRGGMGGPSSNSSGGGSTPAPPPPPARRRRKRDAGGSTTPSPSQSNTSASPVSPPPELPEHSLDTLGVSGVGWCFHSEAEQKIITRNYILNKCPDSEVLGEFPIHPSLLPNNGEGATEDPNDTKAEDYPVEEGGEEETTPAVAVVMSSTPAGPGEEGGEGTTEGPKE